jgi:hypothetical protein
MNKLIRIIVEIGINKYLKDKRKLDTANDITRRRSEYR